MARKVSVHGPLGPISGELRQHVAFDGGNLVFVNPLLLYRRHRSPLRLIKGS